MTTYRSASPRIRLFRNDLLERFTLISPVAFALVWAVFLGIALYASWGVTNAVASIALVAAGVLIWTLFEYAMHRFFFHYELPKIGAWLNVVESRDPTCTALPEEAF